MTKLTQRLGEARFAADEHYTRALQVFQAGRLPEALDYIGSAIELLPNHAEYLAMQGWIHYQADAIQAAQDAFNRALDANPYEMIANYGKGLQAYREKNWEAARSFFLNALAAQPERPETQYYLALVSHRQGENAHALQWMQAAGANFTKVDDDRVEHCQAWNREFAKLLQDKMSHKS